MRQITKKGNRLLLAATLLISPLCLTSCAVRQVRIIPADREVRKLDNGNYEVTPAWLLERYETERYWKGQAEKK